MLILVVASLQSYLADSEIEIKSSWMQEMHIVIFFVDFTRATSLQLSPYVLPRTPSRWWPVRLCARPVTSPDSRFPCHHHRNCLPRRCFLSATIEITKNRACVTPSHMCSQVCFNPRLSPPAGPPLPHVVSPPTRLPQFVTSYLLSTMSQLPPDSRRLWLARFCPISSTALTHAAPAASSSWSSFLPMSIPPVIHERLALCACLLALTGHCTPAVIRALHTPSSLHPSFYIRIPSFYLFRLSTRHPHLHQTRFSPPSSSSVFSFVGFS